MTRSFAQIIVILPNDTEKLSQMTGSRLANNRHFTHGRRNQANDSVKAETTSGGGMRVQLSQRSRSTRRGWSSFRAYPVKREWG